MTNKKIILPKIPDYFHRELINDKGLQGNIFRYSKELIYKEYKTDNFNLPQLELLTEQVSTYMAFPKVLVFEGDYSYESFKGYLSDYFEGNVIYNLNGQILIREFVKALEVFEMEVIKLSKMGIRVHDMHQENLILTPDNVIVGVDTDLFEVTSEFTIELLRSNMKELSETIISELVKLAQIESSRLNDLVNECGAYGRIKPSALLKEFINYFEQRMFRIETVSDFKNGMRLIRKK